MVLYTTIEPQAIFWDQKNLQYCYKKVANCIVEGVKYNEEICINRIISTNLKDYLNDAYQIGARF